MIAGTSNLGTGTKTLNKVEHSVTNIIPHPKYIDGLSYNDIALLELDQELHFSDHIFPVCLPNQANPNSDHRMHQATTLTGWGENEARQTVTELRQAQLTIFASSHCNFTRWQINRHTGLNESSSSLVPDLFQCSIMCAGIDIVQITFCSHCC